MVTDNLIDLLMAEGIVGAQSVRSPAISALEAALDYIPDMVFIKDRNFVLRLANRAFCDKTGLSREQVVGKQAKDLYPPDIATVFQQRDQDLYTSRKMVRYEQWIVNHKGERCLLDTLKVPLLDRSREFQGVFAISYDITEQKRREMERDSLISSLKDTLEMLQKQSQVLKKLNDQLNDIAITDALTQVANRRYFDRQYDIEWRRCQRDKMPLSVMLIDVDHFKNYNDYYGHTEGDSCLRRVASVLSRQLGRPGDVLARYGGEEFVVILPNTRDNLGQMARRCVQAVYKLRIPQAPSAAHPYVSVSIGAVVGYPQHLDSSTELLDLADQHLYLAKQRGRNTYTLLGEDD